MFGLEWWQILLVLGLLGALIWWLTHRKKCVTNTTLPKTDEFFCANCQQPMAEASVGVGRACQLKGGRRVLKGGTLCYSCSILPLSALSKVME